MFVRRPHALFGAIALSLLSAPVQAEEIRARYDAWIFGIPIGKAVFKSRIDGTGFDISGTFGSAGIARLFEQTDGDVSARGGFGKAQTQPVAYELKYSSGRKRQTTAIRFSNGRVTETHNQPPPKKRGEDWVAVSDSDLEGVTDPLSALLLPAAGAKDVCNRTVKVYDGEIRADLVLSPASKNERLPNGTVTCRAKFVPVSGYRKGRSAIKFLRDKARILVAFAPVGETGIHSPVEATVGTEIGTVRVRARALD